MALKQPIGFKEQVQKLVSHGIFVEDEQNVEKILRCINYYRLTGYALQFRKSPKDSDCVDGTTVEQIFRNIRKCLSDKRNPSFRIFYTGSIHRKHFYPKSFPRVTGGTLPGAA